MNLKVKRLKILERADTLKGFADIEYEGLEINGCRIVEGRQGIFISMPREKGKDDKWYDVCRFNDIALKREFEQKILAQYYAEKNVQPIVNQLPPVE